MICVGYPGGFNINDHFFDLSDRFNEERDKSRKVSPTLSPLPSFIFPNRMNR